MSTTRLPVAPDRSAPASHALALHAPVRPAPVSQRRAVAALAAAGVAWGTSVPLSKAALGWLSPGWLVVARFALAAAILLVMVDRRALRAAFRWQVLAWGAVGFGGSVLLQNTGLARTSVTHTALLIGTGPVLVAVIAAAWHRNVARPGPPGPASRSRSAASWWWPAGTAAAPAASATPWSCSRC